MLPLSLLPTRRPVEALLGMGEGEFLDLYVGDGDGAEFDEPDAAVIDAFEALVDERVDALVPQWRHRDAVADIVGCFVPLAADVATLDATMLEVSRWLCANGTHSQLRSLGTRYETAEAMAHAAAEAAARGEDADHALCTAAQTAGQLAETCMLHLAFGDVWVQITLMSDRIRVTVDLPGDGEIDMGGHIWDGDGDRDEAPAPDPELAA